MRLFVLCRCCTRECFIGGITASEENDSIGLILIWEGVLRSLVIRQFPTQRIENYSKTPTFQHRAGNITQKFPLIHRQWTIPTHYNFYF